MNTNPDSTAPEDDVAKAFPGELDSLRADLASQKDRSLRLAADFDNFRKRTAQETDRRAAGQKEAFIRELLPVIDNLERALASDESTSPRQLREGVQITLQQLNQFLRHHGIESEDSLGQPFDPHRHDALRMGRDGVRCDEDGNVWAAMGWVGDGSDGVHVFSPDGARIGQIRMPEIISNIAFGGTKRNRLFMTGSTSLYAVYVETRGANIGG